MADAEDLKSSGDFSSCGFDSHPGHQLFSHFETYAVIAPQNSMRRLFATPSRLKLLVILILPLTIPGRAPAQQPASSAGAFLGFDLNTYPGDAAIPVLRKTFSFAGYWLSPPLGARQNTWLGKRHLLISQKFGFLLLYQGPQSNELKSITPAASRGAADASRAAANAKKEGFPPQAIIFLDIEEGGRLPETYHAYLRAWVDRLTRAGYRAGVYCSGMPASEGHGVTIITADDIRHHLAGREVTYFVYNDACPPAPGCVISRHPPAPSASGVPYAAVWQFAQSPRRKEFTARCAATYNADGNCYVPADSKLSWFLDLDASTTSDPSAGRN